MCVIRQALYKLVRVYGGIFFTVHDWVAGFNLVNLPLTFFVFNNKQKTSLL